MYDLVILGGGPAGVAAGIYASRKKLTTLFLTKEFGGQSTESEDIQNWIGTPHISGAEFAQKLEEHLEEYAGDALDIHAREAVEEISKEEDGTFTIKTNKGTYRAKTVLVTTGSHRRTLHIPGAEEFENKGITYCASCDGPLFTDKDVVVIGGGNSALESAAQLLAYTKSVTLLNRSERLRADPVTVENVNANEHMHIITNADPVRIEGDTFVTSMTYFNKEEDKETTLKTDGIFVEIGHIPTTFFMENLVECDEYNNIKADPWNQRTSREGIWAAGDCTNGLYHQNNIAAGDAVKALEDIYLFLRAKK